MRSNSERWRRCAVIWEIEDNKNSNRKENFCFYFPANANAAKIEYDIYEKKQSTCLSMLSIRFVWFCFDIFFYTLCFYWFSTFPCATFIPFFPFSFSLIESLLLINTICVFIGKRNRKSLTHVRNTSIYLYAFLSVYEQLTAFKYKYIYIERFFSVVVSIA